MFGKQIKFHNQNRHFQSPKVILNTFFDVTPYLIPISFLQGSVLGTKDNLSHPAFHQTAAYLFFMPQLQAHNLNNISEINPKLLGGHVFLALSINQS